MAAPDFRIEPLDPRLRIVNPADSARRGRDSRSHSGEEGDRETAEHLVDDEEPPAADPQAPPLPGPRLDILA